LNFLLGRRGSPTGSVNVIKWRAAKRLAFCQPVGTIAGMELNGLLVL
jgi:hypothetical protein